MVLGVDMKLVVDHQFSNHIHSSPRTHIETQDIKTQPQPNHYLGAESVCEFQKKEKKKG